jgi:hypothetical protein
MAEAAVGPERGLVVRNGPQWSAVVRSGGSIILTYYIPNVGHQDSFEEVLRSSIPSARLLPEPGANSSSQDDPASLHVVSCTPIVWAMLSALSPPRMLLKLFVGVVGVLYIVTLREA